MAYPPKRGVPPPDKLKELAEQYLKELERGPWPSHVTELRKTGYPLHVYGAGLVVGKSPWAPSAVRTRYLTGTMARIARPWLGMPGEEIHLRVFHTPGRFLKTDWFRKLLAAIQEYAIGLLEVIGQTGNMIINITKKEYAEVVADRLRELGTDVGGSADAVRALAACVGPALCEFACFDTLKLWCDLHLDPRVHENIRAPNFHYKFKPKLSGCPFDCARASRGDLGLLGTWKGAPEVDQELLREKVKRGEVDPRELEIKCVSGAISWDPARQELRINERRCVRCMECVRLAHPAIKPGREKRIAVLLGGNNKGYYGVKLGWFVGYLPPDVSAKRVVDMMEKIWEVWDKYGMPKQRLADVIIYLGIQRFVKEAELDKFLIEMPVFFEKMPDDVPYRILPQEERQLYIEYAKKARQELGI
jgi:sulfite reductase alpha subunit